MGWIPESTRNLPCAAVSLPRWATGRSLAMLTILSGAHPCSGTGREQTVNGGRETARGAPCGAPWGACAPCDVAGADAREGLWAVRCRRRPVRRGAARRSDGPPHEA
ncbi:hypothetical protein GCM10018787_15650 [Streptomyces thermodiastaticus]|nr:hypothetical protein GCM10018787_15650 [Streptomyces thermodiastaticus]